MTSVLLASLRRPAPLIGSLVALTMSALIIVIASAFIGTGARATGPVDRLRRRSRRGDRQPAAHRARGRRSGIGAAA